jgi:hypothetical protein
MRVLTMTGVALLAAASAFAQDEAARKTAVEIAARVPLEKATLNAPYSAETAVEGLQVLADGNRISRKTTGRVYRDGEGRTRREEDGPNGRVSISIVDPVGGYSYSLDPESKVAWRTPTGTAAGIMSKLKAVEAREKLEREAVISKKTEADGEVRLRSGVPVGAVMTAADKEKLARANEAAGVVAAAPPLEQRLLDGLLVEGRKTTRTIPAGKVGNERPLTVTNEEWRSPDLNVLVLTRFSDPRTGESSYRLTNIVRGEPDPSLFMVPPDYTVQDTGVRKMLESSRK